MPAVLLAFMACAEEDDPDVYDPNHEPGPQPVISSMDPADSSYAGVGTITITGEHFTPITPYGEYNQVFFDALKAEIMDVTETEILINSPSYIADDIDVKVASRKSDLFSEPVKYKLKAAVDTAFGDLDNLPKPHVIYGVASDLEGNVYISATMQGEQLRGTLKKIDPNGETHIILIDGSDQTDYLKANTMKYGPDNKLYVGVVLGRPKQIRTIDPETGVEEIFVTISVIPRDMDFDMNDNLWIVGMEDVVRVKPDGTVDNMASYPVELNAVRIYEDAGISYLYVAGYNEDTGEHKIWRQELKSDETLGDPEVVLDLETVTWLDEGVVTALTFSEDGMMYLGTTEKPNAMHIYDPATGVHETLYPGLIFPRIYAMVWTEGPYIFASQHYPGLTRGNLLKIDVGKRGAPYYGRQ